jgi:hypothetical protein
VNALLKGIKRKYWYVFLIIVWSVLAQIPNNKLLAFDNLPSTGCSKPANSMVAENCLLGSDDWKQTNHTSPIRIYASSTSVDVGEKIGLFVDSPSGIFNLKVYRIGYYGGAGARLVDTVDGITGGAQPGCVRAEDTGLRTCSNWHESYSLEVPLDWKSGIYLAQVIQSATGAINQTVFVVREDNRKSTILYQMSATTFQAYNNFDGKSVYTVNSGVCYTVAGAPRAVKVSLNRPYNGSIDDANYFFRAEYPMVRWLEQQGYDVTYSTSLDTHRSGKPGAHNSLLDHKVFLSVGHDEYWSQQMHDAVIAARDAGVNIGFFTSNTAYWRIRFEDDPITHEPDSVMVTYKSTESGGPDPSGEPTGTWRDPLGANNPENAVTGIMYIGDNDKMYFPLRLSSEYTSDRLYRHTGLHNMPPNSYIDVGDQIVGWEWDSVADNGSSPQGLQILAETPVYGFMLRDAGRVGNGDLDGGTATVTRYTAPSGAIVFASSTIQWSWGLGAHGMEIVPADPYITQITYNILADMSAEPGSPTPNIILDGSDTPDPTLPTDKIKHDGDVKAPIISNLQSAVSDTSTVISWTTDVETTGQVWYGTQSDHIISPAAIDTGYSKDHSMVVKDLIPGTTYYLKVASTSRDWAYSISDETTFTIPAGSFIQRIRQGVDPLIKQGGCWVRANQTGAVIMGILGLAIVVLLVLPYFILRRRARLAASKSTA